MGSSLLALIALWCISWSIDKEVWSNFLRGFSVGLLYHFVLLFSVEHLLGGASSSVVIWLWILESLPAGVGFGLAAWLLGRGSPRGLSLALGLSLWDLGYELTAVVASPVYVISQPMLLWPAMWFTRPAVIFVAALAISWRLGAAAYLITSLLFSFSTPPTTFRVLPTLLVEPNDPRAPGVDANQRIKVLQPSLHNPTNKVVVLPEESWPRPMGASTDDHRIEEVRAQIQYGVVGVRAGDYNRALVLSPTNVEVYDKHALFPIMEAQYRPGQTPFVFQIKQSAVAIIICYDDSPLKTISAVSDSNLIIALTSEYWATNAQKQLRENTSKILALSTGRAILRASSSGYSSVISPYGQVLWSSPEPGVHAIDVPEVPKTTGLAWPFYWLWLPTFVGTLIGTTPKSGPSITKTTKASPKG